MSGSRSLAASARSKAASASSCSPASKYSQPRLLRSGPAQYAAASDDSASSIPRVDQASIPSQSRDGERAHVCGVAREPVLAGLQRRGERRFEERQRGRLVAARAPEPPALEIDPDPDPRVVLLRGLVEQAVALVEALPKPLDPGQLCQRLGPQRAEAARGRVEVVEVPVST